MTDFLVQLDDDTREEHHGMSTIASTERVARSGKAVLAAAALALITGALALVLGSAGPAEGAHPGLNGKIAYAAFDAVSSNIWVINADGSNRTYLTSSLEHETDPAFSPDGSRIAYVRQTGNSLYVWVMNANGTGQTMLTGGDGPAWSPDGSKIAFRTSRDGNEEIYVMNADGTGQTNLTQHPGGDGGPSWSPDGSKIAFASSRDGNPEVYVMNADGSGQTNLTKNPGIETHPDWSPDGSMIAFTSRRDGTGTTRRSDVFVMNADGSGQTNLTFAIGDEWSPSWSPDGTRIAYSAAPSTNSEVFVMNADGSGQTNLTQLVDEEFSPSWQTLPSADLAVSLVASPAVAKAQKPLTYTITVENLGLSNAAGVVVTDDIPADRLFVSATSSQGSCQTPPAGGTGTVTCNLGFLLAKQSATAQIVVKPLVRKSSVSSTASVASATPDPSPANNSATVTTPVK